MLAYIWCCPVILLATLDLSATANSSEKIADVIKNISRVNNVLQELIQNYEHLQKIYKSQEIFDVPDDNIMFREKNVSYTEKNSFSGTTMYVSDEDKTSKEPSDKTKEHKMEAKLKAHIIKTNITTRNKVSSSKQGRAKVVFIDTRQRILDKEKDRIQLRNINKKTRFSIKDSGPEIDKNNKSKYLLPNTGDDIKVTKTPNRFSTRRKRDRLRSSAGIDNKIINNATIYSTLELNYGGTTAITTVKMQGKVKKPQGMMFILGDQIFTNPSTRKLKDNIQFHHISNKTTPVSHNKNSNSTHLALMMESDSDEENTYKSSKVSSDEGQTLAKYISRTSILRKEYGDACLKLVVRKCYKACKAVYKTVCRHKCKDEFEESYDKFSRTGCIKSFVPSDALTGMCTDVTNCTDIPYDKSSSETVESEEKKKTNKKKKKAMLRGQYFRFNINENTHGYLTAVCQPPRDNTRSLLNKEPTTNTTAYEKSLHILRDKYEKACIKTSREKCKDACTFSYTKACEKNKCNKKKTKHFSKECSRHCKISFKSEVKSKTKSSGSSSSSSSGSSSGSSDSD